MSSSVTPASNLAGATGSVFPWEVKFRPVTSLDESVEGTAVHLNFPAGTVIGAVYRADVHLSTPSTSSGFVEPAGDPIVAGTELRIALPAGFTAPSTEDLTIHVLNGKITNPSVVGSYTLNISTLAGASWPTPARPRPLRPRRRRSRA